MVTKTYRKTIFFENVEDRVGSDKKESGYNPAAQRKLPHPPSELQEIEDRLAGLQTIFREMRNSMKEADLPEVLLSMGTFVGFVGKMEVLARKYRGELDAQATEYKVQRFREKKKRRDRF